MPFIEQWRRKVIQEQGLKGLTIIKPGDRCYVHYKAMVDVWKADPGWTTAHNIFKEMMTNHGLGHVDDDIAYVLAWQVFFYLYVLPYEYTKRDVNGDI